MRKQASRRALLGAAGGTLAVVLAGCSGSDGDANGETTDGGTTAGGGNGDGDGDGATTNGGGTTTDASPTPTATGDGATTIDEFLANTSNYEGVEDLTGTEAVAVDVGAEGNGAFFAFAPAAVRVDAGTTVTWTWTGQGGPHNVAAVQGAEFESQVTSEEGTTFEQVFEDSGTVLYECSPHSGAGMRGAVVVE